MIVVIDNYDSFTYNLIQYAGKIYNDFIVLKNDDEEIKNVNFKNVTHIIISPGPGKPEDSKLSLYVLKVAVRKKIPLLGICLGHQVIGMYFGAKIIKSKEVMHGKLSNIKILRRCKLYNGVKNKFIATRYHSLVVDSMTLPLEIDITSVDNINNEIMSLSHKKLPIYGMQFHPESIKTESGYKMIENFLK